MWLLHMRHDYERRRLFEPRSGPQPRGHRALHEWQHLPLRRLSTHRRRHPGSRPDDERSQQMSELILDDLLLEPERYELFTDTVFSAELDRRSFIRIVGGGLIVACVLG